jgi:glycosyltransferase involved in cell wall biosynthesis
MPFGTRGKALFEAYGVEPSRIFFFPMEPDYDLVAGLTAESIAAASQQFGLDSRRSHLVYSGRLVQAKRVDLLIDAFAAIAPIRPRWDLLVLGDGPLQEALRARVPAELAGRVHWLGHVGDPELVGAVYRASDVLVLPSEFEPWALVVNEAVAAGLAVVSSDVPGAVADLVRDEVNGRIFPSGDLPALRACLFEVTADDKTHVFKAASARVLDEWRERGDPIRGLRAALRHVGLLK